MRESVVLASGLAALITAGACSDGSPTPERTGWDAAIDTVADTVVVRTLGGMMWPDTMRMVREVEVGVVEGEAAYLFGRVNGVTLDASGRIWVLDAQGPDLRVFSSSGAHLMDVGRAGQGPGELGRPDGGIAALSDGRVLVRDPGNGRIQVYGSGGEALATYPIRANHFSSDPLWRDAEDNVYTLVSMESRDDVDGRSWGLERIGPDGVSRDTVLLPRAGYEPTFLEARTETSRARWVVPFSPREVSAFHPGGYFIHGVSDAYRLSLLREIDLHGAPPLRIEREVVPVRIADDEKEAARRQTVRGLRRVDPNWHWEGPDIPETKALFKSVFAGRQGRIWIQRSTHGREIDNPDFEPDVEGSERTVWREDVVFDVFEADGTYLGPVAGATGFDVYPTPYFEGDRILGVTRDELGIERVVLFRLESRRPGVAGAPSVTQR